MKTRQTRQTRQLFTVSNFAKLSRTTKDTLHHYDKIGLLQPTVRGDNNYRYYSAAQTSIVNLIRILQDLGMSLEEIIDIADRRTPEFMSELYADQIENIDTKIAEWVKARKLIVTLQSIISSTLDIDESTITIQSLPVAAIVQGDLNDFSQGRNAYSALSDFYTAAAKRYPDMDPNYPVWGIFSMERIKRGDWNWPDRYYFYYPEGFDKRPADLYAVGYMRGDYGQTEDLYKRMIDYINDQGYEISGDTYEEYPQNELSIADNENYLIRIMITVRKQSPA